MFLSFKPLLVSVKTAAAADKERLLLLVGDSFTLPGCLLLLLGTAASSLPLPHTSFFRAKLSGLSKSIGLIFLCTCFLVLPLQWSEQHQRQQEASVHCLLLRSPHSNATRNFFSLVCFLVCGRCRLCCSLLLQPARLLLADALSAAGVFCPIISVANIFELKHYFLTCTHITSGGGIGCTAAAVWRRTLPTTVLTHRFRLSSLASEQQQRFGAVQAVKPRGGSSRGTAAVAAAKTSNDK